MAAHHGGLGVAHPLNIADRAAQERDGGLFLGAAEDEPHPWRLAARRRRRRRRGKVGRLPLDLLQSVLAWGDGGRALGARALGLLGRAQVARVSQASQGQPEMPRLPRVAHATRFAWGCLK